MDTRQLLSCNGGTPNDGGIDNRRLAVPILRDPKLDHYFQRFKEVNGEETMQRLREEGAAYLAERLRPKAWNPVASPVVRVPGEAEGYEAASRQSYDAHTQALYFGLLRDTDTRLNESGFYDTFFTNDNNASVQLRV